MLLSDLLGATVVDAEGRNLGPVRDVRARRSDDGRLRVHSIIVGGHRLAHTFGYIDQRSRGPWLLRRLATSGGRGTAVAIPAELVSEWDTPVRLAVPAQDLPASTDEETR